MIKFFKSDYQYNWVSDEGQFVGFSSRQNCCKYFGYRYVYEIFDNLESVICDDNIYTSLEFYIENNEVNEYYFGNFIVYKECKPNEENNEENFVYIPIYKGCVKSKTLEGYLVLYNCHNGYYFHGLEYCLEPKLNDVSL